MRYTCTGAALRTLGYFTLFDQVAADRASLASIYGENEEKSKLLVNKLLTTTEIPDPVVEATLKELREATEWVFQHMPDVAEAFAAAEREAWNRFASDNRAEGELNDAADMVDQIAGALHNHSLPDEAYAKLAGHPKRSLFDALNVDIEGTRDAPSRAYLYLEAASNAQVGLLLSERKGGIISALDRFMARVVRSPSAFGVVARVLDALKDKVSAPIAKSVSGLYTHALLRMPPLDRYIVHVAAEQQISILDAVLVIRESRNAKAFRRWLWELQLGMVSPAPATVAKAERALREFEKVAEDWGRELDPRLHVRHERRTLNLEAIPTIGFLFKALGTINVKDPILVPRRHLAFASSLFDDPTHS